MIVRGVDGQRKTVFGAFDSSTPIPRPSQWGSMRALSGEYVDFGAAVSLPAFLRGVRLISETAAGLPAMTYRGHGDERRPAPSAWQLGLLRRPNPDMSPFQAWSYVYASMIRHNAYLWKVKVGRGSRRRLVALYPLNPACVTPKYEGSTPTFEVREAPNGPVKYEVGRETIIHIPGILLEDPYVGVSVVAAHRHELGNDIGRRRFEGRYTANDASPGTILKHTGPIPPTPEQRREVRDSWDARHAGNAGRTGMVFGGWEVDHMPISLQDAQFIESKRYSVQDIGRMLGIPSGFLNDPDAPGGDSPEQENMRLLQHGVGPWMTRLEQGLACDMDLFPEPGWSVEFDEQGFLRAALKDRWDAYRLGRQGGWVTANEIRAREGLPPVEGGDQIQETPVGGAQNSGSSRNGGETADGADDDT